MSKHVLQESKPRFDKLTSEAAFCPGKPDPELVGHGSPTIDLSQNPDIAGGSLPNSWANYQSTNPMDQDTIARANEKPAKV